MKHTHIPLIKKKIKRKVSSFFLGFHFKVTLESDTNNEKQARGIFKIKFNDLQEEITLFEYVSIVCAVEIKYEYLYLFHSVRMNCSNVIHQTQKLYLLLTIQCH